MPPPLAVSLGDPAGIGPEIILKAWLARDAEALPPFFVQHGAGLLRDAATRLGLDCPIVLANTPSEAPAIFAKAMPVLGTGDQGYAPGAPDTSGAALAFQSLRDVADLASTGYASAIVTAPVSKAAINAVSPGFMGQTEFFADQCGAPRDAAVMLLAGPSVKAVPLTVHCALSEVPALITQDLILRRTRIVAAAMRTDFGIANPHIAIAGLNPHAGEDGHLGREEIETISPAIAQLQSEGINATGPHPADALFAPHKRGSYDVAIAMYHDQALAPMKALDFDSGVNMTLGLPIVRTSPDHGTAFDIAGKGVADPGAMIAAIQMAGEVAARRRKAEARSS